MDPERLRFDFTHFQSMTAEELKKVEDIVNEKIVEAIPVETKIMTIEEAKKTGAMALFGEKYGESVRVVCIDSLRSSVVVHMLLIQLISDFLRLYQRQVLLLV